MSSLSNNVDEAMMQLSLREKRMKCWHIYSPFSEMCAGCGKITGNKKMTDVQRINADMVEAEIKNKVIDLEGMADEANKGK